MTEYDDIRKRYRPDTINYLLVMESSPPSSGAISSSRHFYREDYQKPNDRVFSNTMKAVFDDAAELETSELEANKGEWLERFCEAGLYLIEALEKSLRHGVTKPERQEMLREHTDEIIARIGSLAGPTTKIILIKSNVFEVLAGPLRQEGFNVLNTELLDYPGQYNQRAYREKSSGMIKTSSAG